jgi:acetyl-CoA carboxylase/biotin carboxylase 1
VLIANNGMAATKSILSMRQWAYMELGDDRAIEFIAMATPEDLNANAEFIRLADRFVEVRPPTTQILGGRAPSLRHY